MPENKLAAIRRSSCSVVNTSLFGVIRDKQHVPENKLAAIQKKIIVGGEERACWIVVFNMMVMENKAAGLTRTSGSVVKAPCVTRDEQDMENKLAAIRRASGSVIQRPMLV